MDYGRDRPRAPPGLVVRANPATVSITSVNVAEVETSHARVVARRLTELSSGFLPRLANNPLTSLKRLVCLSAHLWAGVARISALWLTRACCIWIVWHGKTKELQPRSY